nr:M23 family metallopeptidase [Caldalkalibacillus salinus]
MNQDHHHTLTYEVQEGDTLSGIAVAHDVKQSEIMRINHIENKHQLSIGEKLKIPLKERKYVVKHGETVESIAREQGIPLEDILANNRMVIESNPALYPGQEIHLPQAPAEPVHQPLSTPRRYAEKGQVTVASRSQDAKVDGSFIWPLDGTLTSTYGMRWGKPHNGIDISNAQRANAPIVAAQSGVVTDAYYHRGGYGNLVIISHGDGLETYYAHLSSMTVSEGMHISQGETIGYMGQTGHATGYHLHFEIRINNRPVNPINHLP